MEKANLNRVYGIKKICSDAQLRKVLDSIDSKFIRDYFPLKFKDLEKSGFLSEYSYKIGTSKYLLCFSDGAVL